MAEGRLLSMDMVSAGSTAQVARPSGYARMLRPPTILVSGGNRPRAARAMVGLVAGMGQSNASFGVLILEDFKIGEKVIRVPNILYKY